MSPFTEACKDLLHIYELLMILLFFRNREHKLDICLSKLCFVPEIANNPSWIYSQLNCFMTGHLWSVLKWLQNALEFLFSCLGTFKNVVLWCYKITSLRERHAIWRYKVNQRKSYVTVLRRDRAIEFPPKPCRIRTWV